MTASKPSIQWTVSEPFAENTFIVFRPDNPRCVLVDPGLEPEKYCRKIRELELQPEAVLITHGHSDHIAGIEPTLQQWPGIPVIVGRGDADKLTDPNKNLSAAFGLPLVCPAADRTVSDGDELTVADIPWRVYETPGHSIGHVVFVTGAGDATLVLGGDVLFQGGIGRTDFPDGSFEQLRDSIHGKLFCLPDETIVYPGHGPPTTIGHEKRTNPFVAIT